MHWFAKEERLWTTGHIILRCQNNLALILCYSCVVKFQGPNSPIWGLITYTMDQQWCSSEKKPLERHQRGSEGSFQASFTWKVPSEAVKTPWSLSLWNHWQSKVHIYYLSLIVSHLFIFWYSYVIDLLNFFGKKVLYCNFWIALSCKYLYL